jgi:hypothetical protein
VGARGWRSLPSSSMAERAVSRRKGLRRRERRRGRVRKTSWREYAERREVEGRVEVVVQRWMREEALTTLSSLLFRRPDIGRKKLQSSRGPGTMPDAKQMYRFFKRKRRVERQGRKEGSFMKP